MSTEQFEERKEIICGHPINYVRVGDGPHNLCFSPGVIGTAFLQFFAFSKKKNPFICTFARHLGNGFSHDTGKLRPEEVHDGRLGHAGLWEVEAS